MSYAAPQQSEPRRGSPWLLIIGGILALIATLVCCGGLFFTGSYAMDLQDATKHTGSHTMQLEKDESVALWVEEGSGAACSVSGPSGAVSNDAGSDQTLSINGEDYQRAFAFDAPQEGTYTASCTGTYVVGESLPMGSVGVMGIGGALCCVSVIVIVIGLVVWLKKRNG